MDPARPYIEGCFLPAGIDEHDLVASLWDGKELVSYSPIRLTPQDMPPVVTPPPAPQEIKTSESYILLASSLAVSRPAWIRYLYWREAFRRDPGDSKVNTVMGIVALGEARSPRRGRYLRKALERATDRCYTTPEDAEPDFLSWRYSQGRRQDR